MKSFVSSAMTKFNEFSPWLLAGTVALLSGLAGSVLWEAFGMWQKDIPRQLDIIKFALVVLYVASIWLLFRRRNVFFRPRTRYLKDISKVKPKKNLIVFLSHLNEDGFENGIPPWLRLTDENDYDLDFKEMERLKKEQNRRWNWQMPLQAVYHHHKQLQQVVLICSDANTSIGAVHHFVNICRRYAPLKLVDFQVYRSAAPHITAVPDHPIKASEGVSFESFDQLSRAVWHILKQLHRSQVKEKDVVIDFTGGMKVTSVVAAAATFNRRINAQYVNTRTMQVNGYDVVFSSSALDEQELM